MLTFIEYITEVLNQDQTEYVTKHVAPPDRGTRPTSFSDHLFDVKNPPEGGTVLDKNTTVFKMPTHNIEAENFVRLHLHRRGYVVHDYGKGLARKHDNDKGNPIKIGKILSQETPPPERKPWYDDETHKIELDKHGRNESDRKTALNLFNASMARKHTGKPLELMITRDPHKISQMSTNMPWRTCTTLGDCPTRGTFTGSIKGVVKDFGEKLRSTFGRKRSAEPSPTESGENEAGINAHRVRDVVQSGTHIGYVIHPGDYDLKKPVARIAMIPYHGVKIPTGSDGSPIEKFSSSGQYLSHGGHPLLTNDGNARGGTFRATVINPIRAALGKTTEPSWDKISSGLGIHTILRPSSTVYGTGDPHKVGRTGFAKHITSYVHSILQKHFPMRDPTEHSYAMDPRAYNDGDTTHWSGEHEKLGPQAPGFPQ